MNSRRTVAITILWPTFISLLCGCSTRRELVIQEPIGPTRTVPAHGADTGQLVVYSAWDRFDTLDSGHPKHTPYTVSSPKGATVARVRNQSGSFGQEPVVVTLPPGHYWVQARATNVGQVRVPVVVRAGQNTLVYLDGSTTPPAAAQAEDRWIRQPDGLIVGWKDNQGDQ